MGKGGNLVGNLRWNKKNRIDFITSKHRKVFYLLNKFSVIWSIKYLSCLSLKKLVLTSNLSYLKNNDSAT